jgi:hypothetical protein
VLYRRPVFAVLFSEKKKKDWLVGLIEYCTGSNKYRHQVAEQGETW